jgi:hypothetical protein
LGDADIVKWGAVLLPLIVLSLACNSPRPTVPLFEEVSQKTGLDFWQFSGATGDLNLSEINGSGAALIDYDNDGDLDLYLVQAPDDRGICGWISAARSRGFSRTRYKKPYASAASRIRISRISLKTGSALLSFECNGISDV